MGFVMVAKKKKFTMEMLPSDKALFARAKKSSGQATQAAAIRMALQMLSKGGK